MHRGQGFAHVGVLKDCGWKFGQWRDVVLMEKVLGEGSTHEPRMKNKTVAAWLAFLGGPLGLHCFYLRGFGSTLGWLLPIPTALGPLRRRARCASMAWTTA